MTFYLQQSRPPDDKVANWLPAPHGHLQPHHAPLHPLAAVLDKIYTLPAVPKS